MKRKTSDFLQVSSDSSNNAKKQKKTLFDHGYFQPWLSGLRVPIAITQHAKLNFANNVLGMAHEKVTPVLEWCAQQQEKYPKCVILYKCGSFFETVGMASIFLLEFAGLRNMGERLKAGTPVGSVQQTLDSLVNQDLRVAVFIEETHPATGSITRVLDQIVCRENPVLVSSIVDIGEDIVQVAKHVLAIIEQSKIMQINIMTREYTVLDQVPSDTMKLLLSNINRSKCIYIAHTEHNNNLRTFINRHLNDPDVEFVVCDAHFQKDVDEIVLKMVCDDFQIGKCRRVSMNEIDNTVLPLLSSTAIELGLVNTTHASVPSLVTHMLGTAPVVCRNFISNWLLSPPNRPTRDAMATLVKGVCDGTIAVPRGAGKTLLASAKIQALLRARSFANDPDFFKKLQKNIDQVLAFTDSTLVLISSIVSRSMTFSIPSRADIERLKEVLSLKLMVDIDITGKTVPALASLFEANEIHVCFNDDLLLKHQELHEAKKAILGFINENKLANALVFFPSENDVVIDTKLCTKIEASRIKGICNVRPMSSKNKPRRVTLATSKVLSELCVRYIDVASAYTKLQVTSACAFARQLFNTHINSVVFVLDALVMLTAVYKHLTHAVSNGWNSVGVDNDQVDIKEAWPYWMTSKASTKNNWAMSRGDGWLITAPNCYGKSTFIRTMVVVALLGNCGFYCPCERGSFVPFFSSYFVRFPASDDVKRLLSGFSREILDLSILTSNVDSRSLVALDELGRGTSHKESIAVCLSVIEYLQEKGASLLFSTHLHDLLDKQIGLRKVSFENFRVLLDAESRNSRAFQVCEKFKLPASILDNISRRLEMDNQSSSSLSSTEEKEPFKVALDMARCLGRSPVVFNCDECISPGLLRSAATVYIIEEVCNEGVASIYIGESDNVVRRRGQHVKTKSRDGRIAVISVNDKTVARELESTLQRDLLKKGVNVSDATDAFHI